MDFHELQKTRVADLREMMKEHLPQVEGVIGLKKEDLVDQLAEKLGISVEEFDALTPREIFALQAEKGLDEDKDMTMEAEASKLVDTKIDGDKATLTIDTNGEQEKVQLIKIDGKWYMEG